MRVVIERAYGEGYLPQAYLRRFAADSGELYVLERGDGDGLVQSETSLPFRFSKDGLFGTFLLGADGNEARAGRALSSQFEEVTERALRALARPNSPPEAQEKRELAFFINGQIERVAEVVDRYEERVRLIEEEMLRTSETRHFLQSERLVNAGFDKEQLVRNLALEMLCAGLEDQETIDAFARFELQILDVDGEGTGVTGDRPLVLNGGVRSFPVEWYTLALSPRRLLLASAQGAFRVSDQERRTLSLHHLCVVMKQSARLFGARPFVGPLREIAQRYLSRG